MNQKLIGSLIAYSTLTFLGLFTNNQVQAASFSVEINGVLESLPNDPDKLNGATVNIIYSGNTTDVPIDTQVSPGVQALTKFNLDTKVFIKNRPDNAPDIITESKIIDLGLINSFESPLFPGSGTDSLEFNRATFDNLGDTFITELSVDVWRTNGKFFLEEIPINTLSFFESVPDLSSDISLIPTITGAISGIDGFRTHVIGQNGDMLDIKVNVDDQPPVSTPEPTSLIGLLAFGGAGLLSSIRFNSVRS